MSEMDEEKTMEEQKKGTDRNREQNRRCERIEGNI